MTTIHGKNVNDFCDRTGSPARRKTKDKQTTKPHKKHTEVSIQKTVLIDIWIQVFKAAWPRGPSD